MLVLKDKERSPEFEKNFASAIVDFINGDDDTYVERSIPFDCGVYKRNPSTGELERFTGDKNFNRLFIAFGHVFVDIDLPGVKVFFGGIFPNKDKGYSVSMFGVAGVTPVMLLITNIFSKGKQVLSIAKPKDFNGYATSFLSYTTEMIIRNHEKVYFSRTAGSAEFTTAVLDEEYNNPYFVDINRLLNYNVLIKEGDNFKFNQAGIERVLEFKRLLLEAKDK